MDAPSARFGHLIERNDGADFPFYDGTPIAVSTARWWAIIGSCAAGMAVLTLVGWADQRLELIPQAWLVALRGHDVGARS